MLKYLIVAIIKYMPNCRGYRLKLKSIQSRAIGLFIRPIVCTGSEVGFGELTDGDYLKHSDIN